KDITTQFNQPLVDEMMPLVEIAQQRLHARTERPSWLQTGWIGAGGLLATLLADHGILPSLDHHRLERWQLDHLAPPDPAAPGLRQPLTTARARAWTALDHHIRLAPHSADSEVPTLRPMLATPIPAPVRLVPARRGHRRVVGRLHRPPELRQLLLQLADLLVPPLDR